MIAKTQSYYDNIYYILVCNNFIWPAETELWAVVPAINKNLMRTKLISSIPCHCQAYSTPNLLFTQLPHSGQANHDVCFAHGLYLRKTAQLYPFVREQQRQVSS